MIGRVGDPAWSAPAAAGRTRTGVVVEIAIEIAVANPAMNRVATDAQLARQRALARAVLQVVPEQHPCLPSEHRASARGRRMVMESPAGSYARSRQPDRAADCQIFARHNCQFYSRR